MDCCPIQRVKPTAGLAEKLTSDTRSMLLRSQGFQVGDNLAGMLSGIHLLVYLGNPSVGINEKGVALGELDHPPIGIGPKLWDTSPL